MGGRHAGEDAGGGPLESIAGISYRRNGTIVHNCSRALGSIRNDVPLPPDSGWAWRSAAGCTSGTRPATLTIRGGSLPNHRQSHPHGFFLSGGEECPNGLASRLFAHDDDEGSVAPILTRYAREGVHVYVVLVTDGAQGGAHTSIPRGPELARVRAEEAKCATDALAINAPILLGFPDTALGSYWLTRRSCTG